MNSNLSFDFLGEYMIKGSKMLNGNNIIGEAKVDMIIDGEECELLIGIIEGKKEGAGYIVRSDGSIFMRMMFVNDICEGEVVKYDRYNREVLKGKVSNGKEIGIWREYCDGAEVWRGAYRYGKRDLSAEKRGDLTGCPRELWSMIRATMDSDVVDGAIHVWRWTRGTRCEFRGLGPKNSDELKKRGLCDKTRYNDGSDLSVFDADCVQTIEALEIVWDITMEKPKILCNGLEEWKGVSIDTFTFCDEARGGLKFMIRNLAKLREIYIGIDSLVWYRSFELKDLPSLKSVVFCDWVFCNCQSIVLDSMSGE